ncbi:MAG TPA: PP2C family protein-serine/threonine phosphatase [Cytophagales bacterium]|nr:PP2C family protein-serine/threonine phosphatase [Cytophagales bacterium]
MENDKILKLKELELNSLLEVTQAINLNLAEDALYKIFNFTLRANLNIGKVALFVFDNTWQCKVNFGTKEDFCQIGLNKEILRTKEILYVKDRFKNTPFEEFDVLIPVMHKDKILAQVFVGDIKNLINGNYSGDSSDITFLQALINIIIVAIENKRLARRELQQEAMRKELEIAKTVQTLLFPKKLPYNHNLKIAADYLPHHSVGGDYYDFIEINEDEFLLCIADVSGKGVPAAILMSNFQATLRTLIRQSTYLPQVVRELNHTILQNSNGESFITFFICIYNKATNKLTYINAGHNPPILIDEENKLRYLEKGTTILGAFHPLPFVNEYCIENLKNFLLFAYTDGLVEIPNEEDELFESERLAEFVFEKKELDLKILHTRLIDHINEYKGFSELKDDITLISCRFNS